MKQLILNSVICLSCGETLISRHRHDFVMCSCPQGSFADGGLEYERCGGKDLSLVQSHCFYDNDDFETIRFYLERGSRGKEGNQPLKYIKLKDIDDEYLEALIEYETERNGRFLKFYKAEKKYRKKNGNKNIT